MLTTRAQNNPLISNLTSPKQTGSDISELVTNYMASKHGLHEIDIDHA
jgi:hypothetical protein